jgi:hypothetical protein
MSERESSDGKNLSVLQAVTAEDDTSKAQSITSMTNVDIASTPKTNVMAEDDGISKASNTSMTDVDIVNATKPIVAEADDGFALHGIPFSLTMFSLCLACFMAGLG